VRKGLSMSVMLEPGLSESDAKATAVELGSERVPLFGGDRLAVDPARTEERALGWLFYVQSARFLDNGDAADEVLDVPPVFVHRRSGHAAWVKGYGPSDFVVDSEPDPDWPVRANLAVPAAILVQAAMWVASWWALYLFGRVIGFVPLHFVGWILAAGLAILPTEHVIRWARFRNFNRWFGLVIVLVGIALAESVSSRLHLIPTLELEIDTAAFSFSIEPQLQRLFAAFMMGTGGAFLGQSNRFRRTAWERSPVISAPAEDDDA
jgi:hypothetical protein